MFDVSRLERWQVAALVVVVFLISALLVRVLWNRTVPAVLGGRPIGYGRALLLLLLTGLLFRGPVFTYSWSVEERKQEGLSVTVEGKRTESSGSTADRRGYTIGFP
jgi:hypothetical protein